MLPSTHDSRTIAKLTVFEMEVDTFALPQDQSDVHITWKTEHPLYGVKEISITAADPEHGEAVEMLRYAGFPREPVTFAQGRHHLLPDESLGTLSVRTPAGARSVTYFANEFPRDPGYARLFELLEPLPNRPEQRTFTLPTPDRIELRYKVGSPYTGGQRYMMVARGGRASMSLLHEPTGKERPRTSQLALDPATLDQLAACMAAIDWTHDMPPFDAAFAKTSHTPAQVVVRPAHDDEPYSGAYFVWEQRFADIRWASLFDVLDAIEDMLRREG